MPEWMFLPLLIVPYLFYRGGYRNGYKDAKEEPPTTMRMITVREALERGWFPRPDEDSE